MYTNDILGWIHPEELDWLHETAKRMTSIVELGSYRGKSTDALLSGCPGKVYAVDLFEDTKHLIYPGKEQEVFELPEVDMLTDFMRNVGHHGNLHVVKMDSVMAAKCLPDVDMVFIDTSHEYEPTLNELKAWWPKTKRLLCGHDYNWGAGHVHRAVVDFFGYEPELLRSIWMVWTLEGVKCRE